VGIKPSDEFLSITAAKYIEMAYEWSVSGVKPLDSATPKI
jgi:hypothetical protein